MHPDFRLTDTTPPTVIEVLGLAGDPEYDRRMAEKRAHYQQVGIPLVEWTPRIQALEQVKLPPPTRRKSKSNTAAT